MKTSTLGALLLATATLAPPVALAQTPAKGSPEHIRAVTGRIDTAAIRANARTKSTQCSFSAKMPCNSSTGAPRPPLK